MNYATRLAWTALTMSAVPIVLSPPAHGQGIPVEAASAAQMRDAVKQYRLGVDLLAAKKFEKALELFRYSYGRVESPNSRLMIARALAKLERFPEAYRELVATIEDARRLVPAASKYKKTLAAAEAELSEVYAHVALLKLDVDGKVSLDGEPIEASAWTETQPLPPGDIQLSYELSNGQRVEKTVTLARGATTTVELRSPPLPAPEIQAPGTVQPVVQEGVSYPDLGWVSVGVGAAGLLTFTVFGLLNNAQFNDLEEACPNNSCDNGRSADSETGRTYQTLANVGLGVGLVGGLSAAYFLLFQQQTTPSQGSVALSARVAQPGTDVFVGPRGVMVRGQF